MWELFREDAVSTFTQTASERSHVKGVSGLRAPRCSPRLAVCEAELGAAGRLLGVGEALRGGVCSSQSGGTQWLSCLSCRCPHGFSVPSRERGGEVRPSVARGAGWACPRVIPVFPKAAPGALHRCWKLRARGAGPAWLPCHLWFPSRLLFPFFASFGAGLVLAVPPHRSPCSCGLKVEQAPGGDLSLVLVGSQTTPMLFQGCPPCPPEEALPPRAGDSDFAAAPVLDKPFR